MHYIIIFVFLIISSCSTTPENKKLSQGLDAQGEYELVQKAKKYPHLNIQFGYFSAPDLDPSSVPNPSAHDKYQSRSFNVIEKRYMLRGLDFVRFVINLPEFEEQMLAQPMYLARSGSGPLGSNKAGEQANSQRVLSLLRQFTYTLSIQKHPTEAAAVGVVGMYNYHYPKPQGGADYALWIAFPNKAKLDEGGYVQDSYYHAGTILHEIMHNLGFSHNGKDITGEKKDVVCATAFVFRNIAKKINIKGTALNLKYKKQLDNFRPFYEQRHKNMLVKDTYLDSDLPKKKTANFTPSSYKTNTYILPNGSTELLYILDE